MRYVLLIVSIACATPALAQDAAKSKAICEAALAAPPKGDTRFIIDVQAVARGALGTLELAKTAEGTACLQAIAELDDVRGTLSTAADEAAAKQRDAATLAEHTAAAAAIAKNEKHVVMAYAALWILSVVFLMFLWRRQQGLRTEIATLKRDLDAASK